MGEMTFSEADGTIL